MPGKTDKRKKAEDAGDDDETQLGRRRNKFRRIGSSSKSKVRFAPTTQAISFTKDEQPTSIQKTEPTSFPTSPGGSPSNCEEPPSTNTSPNPSKQPLFEEEEEEEKPFTTAQANELSNIATAALQILQTTEEEEEEEEETKKQLNHDLAATRRELELSRNDNRNLRWRKDMYMDASGIAGRNFEDKSKRLKDAEAELEAALGSNDELKGMLRAANEELEKAQCELARSSSKETVGDEGVLNC